AEEVVDPLALMVRVVAPKAVPRDELVDDIHAERWAAPQTYEFEQIEGGLFAVSGEPSAFGDTVSIGEVVVGNGVTMRLAPAAARYERIVVEVSTFSRAVARVLNSVNI